MFHDVASELVCYQAELISIQLWYGIEKLFADRACAVGTDLTQFDRICDGGTNPQGDVYPFVRFMDTHLNDSCRHFPLLL